MSRNPTQGSTTGTTTSSYVKATDLYTANHNMLYFIISNTGATYTMYYKVWGYAVNGGTGYEVYAGETSIGTSANDQIAIANTGFANVEIYVKNNSGATTYTVEYCLKP